jgi:large subunit ribosomal protein L4
MEAQIYNTTGKAASKIKLPADIFGLTWNADLVHQVVTSMMSNAREPIAHTKTRGEVRGGGKKPWQQKGLGRARHGSIRSPIWVGGGVAHGPRNDKNFSRKINKKMKTKALFTILSKKFKDNEIIFVDSLSFSEPKTKQALEVMKSLSGIKGFERLTQKNKNAAFIAVASKDKMVEKSFQNFGNVEVGEVRNLSPLHVLNYKYLVIAKPEEALKQMAA